MQIQTVEASVNGSSDHVRLDAMKIQVTSREDLPVKVSIHSADWSGSKTAALEYHPDPLNLPDLGWCPMRDSLDNGLLEFTANEVREGMAGGYVRVTVSNSNSEPVYIVAP